MYCIQGWRGTRPIRSPKEARAPLRRALFAQAADWFRSLPMARGLAAPLARKARAARAPRLRRRHRLPRYLVGGVLRPVLDAGG